MMKVQVGTSSTGQSPMIYVGPLAYSHLSQYNTTLFQQANLDQTKYGDQVKRGHEFGGIHFGIFSGHFDFMVALSINLGLEHPFNKEDQPGANPHRGYLLLDYAQAGNLEAAFHKAAEMMAELKTGDFHVLNLAGGKELYEIGLAHAAEMKAWWSNRNTAA